jgi:E3 ubiquitin-protein ligase NEDD4
LGSVELKPGGSEIQVTKDNVEEYLQLFVHRRLFHAIKPQVDAVVEGLAVFVNDELRASLRQYCTVGDVQLLISGVAALDVDDWEASAIYKGGYTAGSQEVGWFWRLVRAMDAEQVQQGLLCSVLHPRA